MMSHVAGMRIDSGKGTVGAGGVNDGQASGSLPIACHPDPGDMTFTRTGAGPMARGYAHAFSRVAGGEL